ncbi:MAG: YdeI/OmpD-associated family protein [Rhizobacter sp.]|nr:YdeI/OmpD-associated family protein [Chlorobiales bacterium]
METILKKFEYPRGMYYLEITGEVADEFFREGKEKNVRVVVRYPNGETVQRALTRFATGAGYVLVSKNHLKALGSEIGGEVTIGIERDRSEFGMKMPEVLSELLRQHPAADRTFKRLTDGVKRSMIYRVSSAKTTAMQIKRTAIILENLKAGKTKVPELISSEKESVATPVRKKRKPNGAMHR